MNSFGPSLSQQYPLVDPRCVREHRARFRRDALPELDKCNSYYSMAGRWPDVGWLLLERRYYDFLSPYSNTFDLVIGDFVNPALTISDISIVQARCVTRGLARDPNAIYLIQVTNNQGVLYNPWFQFPVSAQYNVVAPAYAGAHSNYPPSPTPPPEGPTYYSGSLTGANHTDAWTWNGMVADLWGKASALLGTYPGLPITPPWAPEGWVFVGVPLLEALSRIMEYLGLCISGSYPNYTITVSGAADAAYAVLVARYGTPRGPRYCLEDSMEYLDRGSGRVPSQVVVYFHRRNIVYGTEQTVRRDDPQWQNAPNYSVTVASPSTFSSAVGTGHLWADYTVRYSVDGATGTASPVASDVVQANAVARALVSYYFATAYRGTAGYMRDTYAGVLPFTTGSLVDGVRWYNTGRIGADDDYAGWRTEIVRGYVWDEAKFDISFKGSAGP